MIGHVEESLPGGLLTQEFLSRIRSMGGDGGRFCTGVRNTADMIFPNCFSFIGAAEAPVLFALTNPIWKGNRVANVQPSVRRVLVVLFWILVPVAAFAQEPFGINPTTMTNTGVSGLWILANISFAGMRAQGSSQIGWRIVAFIFGLPGTVLTFLVVSEGGGRAYGIQLPTSDDDDD